MIFTLLNMFIYDAGIASILRCKSSMHLISKGIQYKAKSERESLFG